MHGQQNHLATLDALRGVAAICVVLGHISLHWREGAIVPQGFIAVDMFFLLSGYVITRAYERKLLGALTFGAFVRIRVIRFYPLVLLADLAAAAVNLVKAGHAGLSVYGGILGKAVLSLLLIPCVSPPTGFMFPLNGPLWTMFYEILINLFYAALLPRLTTRRLLLIILAGACVLTWNALPDGRIGIGPSIIDLPVGLSRATTSFFLGVVLCRLQVEGWFNRLPRLSGFWLLLAFPLLLSPWFGGIGIRIYDLACVFLAFPMLLLLGAKTRLPAVAQPVALWLGRVSYPIYLLQVPLIMDNSYRLLHGRHGVALGVACLFAVVAITLASWAAADLYDEPVRKWFNAFWPGRRKEAALPAAPAEG